MRIFGLVICAATVCAAHAAAADARFERSLKMLAPTERLEQLCDYTAMTHIRQDAGHYRPDRAIANAGGVVKIKNNTIETATAAFRSRGKWYSLSYTCSASPDHLQVLSFHYTIGKEIPASKWATLGLWN
jgi:hypothetical protein